MPEARRASFKRYVLIGAAVAAVALLYVLREVLVPLFFAFAVAYALDPIVDKLESWKVPRPAGAVLVLVTLVALLVIAAVIAIPWLLDELTDAAQRLPDQLRSLQGRAETWAWGRFHYKLPTTWGELMAKYGNVLRNSSPESSRILDALFGTVNAIFVLLGTLIIPFFALYLLIDFNRLVRRTELLIPRRWAPDVTKLAKEIHTTLGRYVRGQLVAIVVLATLYSLGLELVGVRLAIPIGALTGFLSFVPYVGLAIGTSLAAIMALLDWHGAGHLVAAIAMMLTVGLLDGMVITPRIVGGSVGLKPIEVLLTMMAAATIFGFFGVLLAVPLGAVSKILIGHVVDVYLESRFYREPPTARPTSSFPPPSVSPVRRSVPPAESPGESVAPQGG